MAGFPIRTFRLLAAALGFIICLAGQAAQADTIKINVFERFRNEMTIAHEVAVAKFLNPAALAGWNTRMAPYFDKKDRQLSHFFAFSMMLPMKKGEDFVMIYFNPWVDGALLTLWKQSDQDWKVADFYMASGQRLRGEITPQSVVSEYDIMPVWLRQKGRFVRNIFDYYTYMRTAISRKPVEDYAAWFTLSESERAADLLRVKFRMRARLELATAYIVGGKSGPVLSGAFAKLKYDAIFGNKARLSTYSRHADTLVSFRPEIIKTLRENWYFKQGNVYSIVLSSPIMPRFFVFMNVEPSGRIQGVLLGDLEAMAAAAKTAPGHAVRPGQSSRKVHKYTDAQGNQVEVITEKKDGKVTMTTRVNGAVTEVVSF